MTLIFAGFHCLRSSMPYVTSARLVNCIIFLTAVVCRPPTIEYFPSPSAFLCALEQLHMNFQYQRRRFEKRRFSIFVEKFSKFSDFEKNRNFFDLEGESGELPKLLPFCRKCVFEKNIFSPRTNIFSDLRKKLDIISM